MPLLPPDSANGTVPPLDAGCEAAIERFEAAWRTGESVPRIRDFLAESTTDVPNRSRLLHELILIDLEYRWRRFSEARSAAADPLPPGLPSSRSAACDGTNRPLRLDDYASEFLELWPVEQLPVELIAEEYRVRHCWGDRPSHAEYGERFPGRETTILSALRSVDLEMRRERPNETADEAPTAEAIASTAAIPQSYRSDRDILLQAHIGTGGVGRVYRAWLKGTRQTVAVKFLKKARQRNRRAVERFLHEAETLALLRHPGIVRLHHVGRMRNGVVFLVMDFVAGGDLSERLSLGPIPWRQAAGWVREAAEAVQHAHERGIIHCDLKPGNLLLDAEGRVRLTDFGLAARLHGNSMRERGAGGTLGYMAPEQLDPAWGPIGPRTDVFGLGALLAALLIGEPPCAGVTVPEVLGGILEGKHISALEMLEGEVPKELIELCRRCLTPTAADRWDSAADLARALRDLLERESAR